MLCTALQRQPIPDSAMPPSALPDVWRASELAVSRAPVQPTGHAPLDAQLPNGGWPRSTLVELLLQQSGIGELQLLKPILRALAKDQRIALVQPPYLPHARALKTWGIDTSRLLWLRADRAGDAQWATEQILRNGSCGAVVLWQTHIRSESLRRLHLAAQSTDTWFWLMRPLSCASEASPAPLRLGLRPAVGGVAVDVLKRRGPACDAALYIPLPDMPAGRHPLHHENAPAVQFAPAAITARNAAPVLV
ncbi:translesion DNA synthesis-associated protein ImuA [Duganella margarita]|nr:translesion DNA synthesis-associated protein ImuA [Duganella margarita]